MSFLNLSLCNIYFDIFYVESLNRVRRKRKVSKEIKVAVEENDFDVKNGALSI